MLHLLGMDHETDDGEMLALQRELLAGAGAVTRSGFVALAGTAQRRQVDARQRRRRREGRDRLRPPPDHPAGDPRRAPQRRLPDRARRPARRAAPARRAHRAHGAPRAAGARGLRRRAADAQRRAGRRPGRPLHRAGRSPSAQRPGRRSPSTRSTGSSRAPLLAVLAQAAELELGDEVFPISARTGAGVRALVEHLAALMPEGPFMFAAGRRIRPAARAAARRADPRGGHQAHLPGGAARGRGRRRGDRARPATGWRG